MKSYRDLEIFRSAYDLAVKVHKFSLAVPKYEMFEEESQTRRSSRGVSACIVEGYGRRRYRAGFIKFLVYAHATCDETIIHISFIQDTHGPDHGVRELLDVYNTLGAKINRFIKYVEKKWE